MKLVSLLLFPIFLVFAQTPNVEQAARIGFESINTDDLKKFDTYLSSDALQGRETSYPGERLAAKFIAEHFQSLGLKPIGDDGSYLQRYQVQLIRVDDKSNIVVNAGTELKSFSWLKDFMAFPGRDTSVTGSAAFVGFTDNRAPEQEVTKLAGKVVFMFVGPRRALNDTTATQARGRGAMSRSIPNAAATIVVLDEMGSASYARVSSQLASTGLMRGRMQLKSDSHAWPIRGLPILLFASPEVAEAVLSGSGQSLNDIRQRAFQDSMFTPVIIDRTNVTVDMRTSVEDREAENVVGLLEGSDPVLKKQVVVFSAHFDHLGMGTDGAIYHGADDDASGTSMVMELAAAYTKNLVRPKRSLLFLTVSGEEKGLLGSNYYTTHPIIPLDETIADFNTDMIGRIDTTHEKTKDVPYTYIIGSDKISTELDSVLQVANKESNNLQIDYTYNNPDDPNRFYQRSDHYNFARKGIPIAFFFTGVHADYHRPTDTVDKILFDRMKEIGQLVYYAGWKTANFSRMFSKNVSSSEYR
jgi:hypothetical protein